MQKDKKNDNEKTGREDERGSKWFIEKTTCVDSQKMYLWIFIYARLNEIKKKENDEWKKKYIDDLIKIDGHKFKM